MHYIIYDFLIPRWKNIRPGIFSDTNGENLAYLGGDEDVREGVNGKIGFAHFWFLSIFEPLGLLDSFLILVKNFALSL